MRGFVQETIILLAVQTKKKEFIFVVERKRTSRMSVVELHLSMKSILLA